MSIFIVLPRCFVEILPFELLFTMLANLHEVLTKLSYDKFTQEFLLKPNSENLHDKSIEEMCNAFHYNPLHSTALHVP
jgi:hypothetical protein